MIATAARRFARGMLAPVPPIVHNTHREPDGCRLLGKCQGWRGNAGQRPGLLEIAAVSQTAVIPLATRNYTSRLLSFVTHSPEKGDRKYRSARLRPVRSERPLECRSADPARVSHGMFAPSATRPSRAWFEGQLLGLYVHASPSFG